MDNLIRKISINLIRTMFPGCYVRQNENVFSIRIEGKSFGNANLLEDAIYIHKFPSPKAATILGEMNRVIQSFEDTRVRNGRRYIYINHNLRVMHYHGTTISKYFNLLESLAKKIGEVSTIYSILEETINEHIEKKKNEAIKMQELQIKLLERLAKERANQITGQENPLYNSINDQLQKKRASIQSKFDNIIVKNKENSNYHITKWVQVGDLIRIIFCNGTPLVFPPEEEIAIPDDCQFYSNDVVSDIKNNLIYTKGNFEASIRESHWLPLEALYDKEPNGVFYKTDGSFVVKHNMVEYNFKTYASVLEFVNISNLEVDVDNIRVYGDPNAILERKELFEPSSQT